MNRIAPTGKRPICAGHHERHATGSACPVYGAPVTDDRPRLAAASPVLQTLSLLRERIAELDNDASAVAVASLAPSTRALVTQLTAAADPALLDQLAGELDADSLARILQWVETSRSIRALLDELEGQLRDALR